MAVRRRRPARSVRANPAPERFEEHLLPFGLIKRDLRLTTRLLWLERGAGAARSQAYELLYLPDDAAGQFWFTAVREPRGAIVRAVHDDDRLLVESKPEVKQDDPVFAVEFDARGAVRMGDEELRKLGIHGYLVLQQMLARWPELAGADPGGWVAPSIDAWMQRYGAHYRRAE